MEKLRVFIVKWTINGKNEIIIIRLKFLIKKLL